MQSSHSARSGVVVDGVAGDKGALVAGVWEAGGDGFGGEVGVFRGSGGQDIGGMGDLSHAADIVVVAVVDQLQSDVAVLAAHGAEEALIGLEGHTITNPVIAIEGRDMVGI